MVVDGGRAPANLSLPGYVHNEATVWWTESGAAMNTTAPPPRLRSAAHAAEAPPPEHLSIDATTFALEPADMVALAFDEDGWNVTQDNWGAGLKTEAACIDRDSCADLPDNTRTWRAG